MRDGRYALHLMADGFRGHGTFEMRDNAGRAAHDVFDVEGQLLERPSDLRAIFRIQMPHAYHGNAAIPERYTVDMVGAANDHTFDVIGIGPLGVIVEIAGEWCGPLTETAGD